MEACRLKNIDLSGLPDTFILTVLVGGYITYTQLAEFIVSHVHMGYNDVHM